MKLRTGVKKLFFALLIKLVAVGNLWASDWCWESGNIYFVIERDEESVGLAYFTDSGSLAIDIEIFAKYDDLNQEFRGFAEDSFGNVYRFRWDLEVNVVSFDVIGCVEPRASRVVAGSKEVVSDSINLQSDDESTSLDDPQDFP